MKGATRTWTPSEALPDRRAEATLVDKSIEQLGHAVTVPSGARCLSVGDAVFELRQIPAGIDAVVLAVALATVEAAAVSIGQLARRDCRLDVSRGQNHDFGAGREHEQ